MSAILVFPAGTFALLMLVFLRAFTRNTGMRARPLSLLIAMLSGALGTLITGLLIVWLKQLLPEHPFMSSGTLSPFLEELVKYLSLLFLVDRLLIGDDSLSMRRQGLLTGVILGLAYGLVETYLFLLTNIQQLTNTGLMGSIPLHMATSGFMAYILFQKKPHMHRVYALLTVIVFHLGYNQIVSLPAPISYLSFALLLASLTLLLNLMNAPWDEAVDGTDPGT